MPKETEAKIEQFFVATVKSMGGKAFKWVSPSQRGVPDRIAFLPGGLIIPAEIKRADGKLHPLQKKIIRTLSDLGTEVIVISSLADVRAFKSVITEVIENVIQMERDDSGDVPRMDK